MLCNQCQQMLPAGAVYCPNCGATVATSTTAATGATTRLPLSSSLPLPGDKCAKCGTTMELGFLPERDQSSSHVTFWVQGAPEWGFFGNLKYNDRPTYYLEAHRCPACGYVEWYARTQRQY